MELSEKSKLNLFIYNFLYGWSANFLRKHDINKVCDVRANNIEVFIVEHGKAFEDYCGSYGMNVVQSQTVYKAAFFWRAKGAKEAVHIFQMSYSDVAARVRWFEKQRAAAEKAAIAAAVIKAAAPSPIVLDLDQSTVDMPLIYWAMRFEVDEVYETEMAEIAYGH